LFGVAVNVIELPEQIDVELAVIDTAGVTEAAVMVIELLEAVGVVVQLALLVITTDTTSPLLRVELVKVDAFAPATSVPLIFH
jgi:hypothetical protein